jgi:ABC-type sugar transport system permease subunit
VSFTFASPLLNAFSRGGIHSILSNCFGDGWGVPFLRSAAFAVVTPIVCIPLGFLFALLAKDCANFLRAPLAILMAPMLMGGVALAFCVKLDVLRSATVVGLIANRAFIPTWGLMLLAQTWQLLTLATYLFWFRLQLVPARIHRFAEGSGLSALEYARDVYWPHARNLAGILTLFISTTSFYEFIKFYLVLRASPGGGTELASHWLLRFYNFYADVDPRVATRMSLAMAGVGIVFAIVVALVAITMTLASIDIGTRWLAKVGSRRPGRHSVRPNLVAACAIVTAVLPVSGLVPYLRWQGFAPISEFSRSVLLALIASIIALLLSVLLGISGRLLLRQTMERFDARSAVVFAALYFVQVIPAIGIALCGYYWLGVLASRGSVAAWVPVLWLACQVIIALPLTASFVQVSHFRVRTIELDFQESSRVGLRDVIWHSFLRRFSLDYLLVAIFGFSIIWTESTVNSTLSNLSRSIPSLAVELTQRVDGRGASYPEAAGLILTTLVPVLLCLSLWVYDNRSGKVFIPSRPIGIPRAEGAVPRT